MLGWLHRPDCKREKRYLPLEVPTAGVAHYGGMREIHACRPGLGRTVRNVLVPSPEAPGVYLLQRSITRWGFGQHTHIIGANLMTVGMTIRILLNWFRGN